MTAAATDEEGGDAYLRTIASTLWPPPARLHDGKPDLPGEPSYLALPNRSRPTLLVPRRPRRAAAIAVRRYNSFGSRRTRVGRHVLAAVLGSGLGDLAADRVVSVSGGRETGIEAYLRDRLGEDIALALYFGPARANRKPVLQVIRPDGTTLGYGKVGVDALTNTLIDAEAVALGRLQHAELKQLRVPRLLLHEQWNDASILVQSALPVWRARADVLAATVHAASAEVATLDREQSVQLTAHAYWSALADRVGSLTAGAAAELLQSGFARLEEQAEGVEVDVGAWHGDWSPWNMAVSRGQLCVWDWERFAAPVPVGYDMLHYFLQHALVVDRMPGQVAVDALMRHSARRSQVLLGTLSATTARVVALCYLVHLAVRYLRDGQAKAGASHGQVHQWLLPALHRNLVAVPT